MNITDFYKQNKILAWTTLGIGLIAGYLGCLLITWIKEKLGFVKKVDDAAQKAFKENLGAAVKGKLARIELKKEKIAEETRKTQVKRINLAETVQSFIKGKQARKEYSEKKLANVIQGAFRGKLERIRYKQTKAQRNELAISLQAAIHGKKARVYFQKQFLPIRDALLPFSIYERWLTHGDGPVFAKSESMYDRYAHNLRVCQFVKDKGYTSLDVPKSRKFEKTILESRLPVVKRDYIEDFGFYLENHKSFDLAVAEFMDLLCHIRIYDIMGGSHLEYGTLIKKSRYGRYDNVCLYIQEGVGRLGLVDLERLSDAPAKTAQEMYFIVIDLISLFPLHYELIISLANKKFPEFKKYEGLLAKIRTKIDAYTRYVYIDRKAWHESKEIALNPKKPIIVSEPEALKDKVKERLLNMNNKGWYRGFLGENPQDSLALFFSQHYENLLKAVLSMVNEQLEFISDSKSPPAIINQRTFEMHPSKLDRFSKIFPKKVYPADLLTEILLALKDVGEIYDYRPNFGVGGYARPTIFC